MEKPKTFDQKCAAVDMCPKCGGELDTGWECNKCGYDALPHVKPERCGKMNPALRAGLPCTKPRGHDGNHEDCCGCWWQ